MQKKQKVDIINALFLILIGIITLILPMFIKVKIEVLIPIIFAAYTISNTIRYLITKESKDYEGLHVGISSFTALIASILIDITTPKTLFIVLMIWIMLISLTKLKKADFYHDRKDRMWKLKAFILGIFILTSLLTCINLANSNITLIIGYYFLINGILESFDPIVKKLIKNS